MISKITRKFFSNSQKAARFTTEDLHSNKDLDFMVSSDFCRVDVGLIIKRFPIFLDMHPKELDNIKEKHLIR